MIDELSNIKERLGKVEAALASITLRQSMASRRPRVELYDAICSNCNKECKVPFKPTTDKPLFCKECYEAHKRRR